MCSDASVVELKDSTSLSESRSVLARYGGHLFWTATDQIINIGVPRLVLYPILAVILGDGAFGSFVVAITLVQTIGLSPSNGLTAYVLRDLAKVEPSEQRVMLKTAACLSGLILLPIAAMFWFGAEYIATLYGNNRAFAGLLPWLGIYLLLVNLCDTLLSATRVARGFQRMVLVHAVQVALFFLAIPFFRWFDIDGVAAAYVVGAAAGTLVAVLLLSSFLKGAPWWSWRFAKAAMRVWPSFSLSAFITLSSGNLDRLLLGYWWSAEAVAPFFAAVATAALWVAPSMPISNLTLSLLGAFKDAHQIPRRRFVQVAAGALGSGVVIFALGWVLGGPLLRLLYPHLADAALPLWGSAVAAFSATHVGTLCRPFVCKFCPPWILPCLAAWTLVTRLVPLLLFIPSGGAKGAVSGLLIGSILSGGAWLVVFVYYFLPREKREGDGLA